MSYTIGYSDEFKTSAVTASYELGVERTAKVFEINVNTLYRWRKEFKGENITPKVKRNMIKAEDILDAKAKAFELERDNAKLRDYILLADAKINSLEAKSAGLLNDIEKHKKTIAALKNALAVLASVQ